MDSDVRVTDYPVLKKHAKAEILTQSEIGENLPIAYLTPGPDLGTHRTQTKRMSAVVESAVRTEQVVGCRGLGWGFDLNKNELLLFAPVASAGLTPREQDLLAFEDSPWLDPR